MECAPGRPYTIAAGSRETVMRERRFPVLLETAKGRVRAGFSAPANEEPVQVALKLRERGRTAFRVRFDTDLGAWIASVIDWKRAA
jgi:hypothetical protein